MNVALVGLSFGLEFAAIYCKHPDVDKVYLVDQNEKLLRIARERYSIPEERCHTDLQEALEYYKTGDTVTVTVKRAVNGEYESYDLELTLGVRTAE